MDIQMYLCSHENEHKRENIQRRKEYHKVVGTNSDTLV